MHRMADELKTSRRREHRWKLILWSPKNTKEEERKETIEQNKRWPKESHPTPLARTRKISESTRSNRLKLHKEPQNIRLVDEIHFSTMNSLQFKRWPMERNLADREQVKWPTIQITAFTAATGSNHLNQASTSHLKKKIQIGTSRIGEDRRKTFPEPI
ncbi:unnamed protein product [Microthlaspi erraticum]|uniref:Uncharacterized protein n=1 Tax=Microthlaspi erraticum TaxID=1685480 RepID=A0A6D2K9W0_9BRAS|nr:unnamed protein product [Microthlaspi erraticum]